MNNVQEPNLNMDILLDFFTDKSKNTKGLYLDETIFGVVDFSILKNKGFKAIEQIHLGTGKITELKNLPDTLKVLVCGNNLLSSLPKLPKTLEEIDVSNNMITSLDLKDTKNLKILNASNNELYEVLNFPVSIEEITLNDNKIVELDLGGLINLKKFESMNNLGIILKNIPEKLDINLDYNPFIKNQDGGSPELIDFQNAMNEYFKWKAEYEKNRLSIKKENKSNKKKPKEVFCVRCKKTGGNFFSKRKDMYKGHCGNKNMCFEIVLDTKSDKMYNIDEKLKGSQIAYNDIKESIMTHKMDIFFNYMKLSQKTVDAEVAKYVKENKSYEEALNEYQEIYNNFGRKESIIAEMVIIDGFDDIMDESNSANLENPVLEKVKIQMDLRNEYEKVRNLKYDISIMENIKDPEKGNIVGSRLVQKDINIRDTFIFSVKPEVIKYFFVPV
jgi:hypothetical protein